MKIAILSAFYPLRGGIAQFGAALYRALETSHEVKAFTFSRQYPNLLFPGKTQYITDQDKADPIPSAEILDSINPLSYYKTAKAINAFAPDVLIINYWMSFFGPSMGKVAKEIKGQTKVVSILHNVIPHEKRFFDSAFTNYFLRQNDGFVVMSAAVKRDLQSLKKNIQEPLLMEHPLYDHFGEKIAQSKAIEQLGLAPDKKTLLFFGFIREYKGLDLLIQAMEFLEDTYQLVIAGESYDAFDKYEDLINQSKYRESILVHNKYIGDEEVPKYFSAADVCVLPYKTATQSGITAIAQHFCLPVIATDVGGLKETIQHGQTGLIVEQAEPKAIGEAIQLYFSEQMKTQFSQNLKAQAKEKSWSNFALRLVEYIKQLND